MTTERELERGLKASHAEHRARFDRQRACHEGIVTPPS
jgi:hypothetical protein